MQAPLTTQPRHHHPTQWTTAVSPYSAPHTHTHPPYTHTHPATSLHYSVNTYQVIINIIQLCQQPPPPPPPTHTHTHTHTQSTALTNTQPAPHTSDSPPFPPIQWRNHLSPVSQYTIIQLIANPVPVNTYQVIIIIIQFCQHPSLPPSSIPTAPYTHTIHWPNQHPASTTHIWLTPIPTHPVTQPSLTSKSIYNHPTHCKPSPSEHIPSHHHYHPILSTPITAPILHPHRPLHTHDPLT